MNTWLPDYDGGEPVSDDGAAAKACSRDWEFGDRTLLTSCVSRQSGTNLERPYIAGGGARSGEKRRVMIIVSGVRRLWMWCVQGGGGGWRGGVEGLGQRGHCSQQVRPAVGR